ncbi:Arginase-2, mitochondrial [Echinococcus granulosus]|uniref:Arginase n=1 Tax=Echinococcus granulosus TaxID=6210 RepID=W6UBM1_ECHGR|nr:Arginase-2 [Echinococcus granulosus]EUB58500.1 Arginase-2 [Echinococcus granulosus]KAH9284184.1 Arginase-2, mitochondrial [Echinococcus granulosus]
MENIFGSRVSSLGIVAAAVDKGQPKDGVQNAPKQIREGGLQDLLEKLGAKVNDYGEITQPKDQESDVILNCENQQALVKTTLELKELVEKSVSENDMTLILGGDHSIGSGSIVGHFTTFPNSFVVWVDAHADINTPQSSASRHTHGMPVSFVLTETNKLIPQTHGFENIKSVLSPNQLLYIGLRDVDSPELGFLKEFNVPYFDMQDVRKLGIKKVMEITLKTIFRYSPNSQVHLSFDIDSLDPKYASCTGTPVPGGLSLEEGKYICKVLAQTGHLRSMVLAEVNTSLGSPKEAKTTVNSAVELIKSALLLD